MAAPQIDSNSLTIFEGQIITISTDNLEASAPGIPPGDIIFTINSPLFGGFFLNGTETSEFSQEDIFRGDVQFRHDGSNSAPQYTVTARVGDEAAEASEPMVSFTPFNDGPRFLNAALSISEGETVILTRDNLLTTDEEGESAPEELTYEILSVTNGEFQRVGDGTPLGEGATFTQADIDAEAIQFIHDGSETSPSYRLQVTDSGIPESPTPKSVRRTVFPNFTPVNDPPVAEDDLAFPGDEDTLITGNVLTNATDPEDDPLTATVVTDVTNGTLTLNPDGSFEYLPNENFNGTDTFTYEVSDGNGGTDQATVTLTVAAVNDPPVAEDDLAFPGDEDTPITGNVLANATDPEGDTLTATVVTDVTNGTLTLNPDGSFEYLPNENFNGTDTFTYEVSDGNGGTDQATVTLTVNPINDPPVAEDDLAFPGDEDTLITGNVLTNATDPEDDPLTATVVTDVTNGTLTLNPDGSFEYLPNENFNGTDTFTYEVSDGNGGTDQATVTLTVAAVNDPPVAEDDLAFPGDEDTPITGNVLANATDPEGDTLTATVVTDVTNGTLTLNPDGSFEYLPNENFNGTDTFTYEVSDGNGGTDQATVTLTVNPINDPPVAEDDLASPGDEDTLITGNVLTNATDPEDDPLTATVVTDVTNGTLTLNPDGSFEYLPNENFNGTDTFTYEVSDGNGGTDQATVTLTVAAVNDPPVAEDDLAFPGDEDTPITGNVLANATDPEGDTLTATVVTDVTNGTLTLNPDGSFEYLPNENFNGTDTFTYEVSDGNGGTDQATVTLTVNPINDPPVAEDDLAFPGDEDTLITGNVLTNATDPEDDPLTATVVTDVTNGTLTLNPDGSFEYLPNENFNGTDTFTYEVSDGNGGTDQATVTLTVAAVNDPPVAEDDLAFPGDEDTPITGNVLANATDPEGDTLTATVVTDVTNGTLTLNPDGSFEYLPNENFNGTDTFTYEVSDGNGGTDQATVTLTVNPINDPPVAEDDLAFPGDEDTLITGNVLTNATDPEDDPLTATVVTDVTNGTLTLNPDGSFEYLPNENFNGTDTFTYEVSDGNGGTDQATVTLTVAAVNDPPVAEDDLAFPGDEDTPITGNVLANATDPEGDTLTATVVTDVTNGTLTLNPDGSFEYLPNENFNGTDTFTYEVSDGNGGTDQATVTLTVNPINDPPVAEDDLAFPGDEDTLITGNVLTNATDPEDDPLTATVVTDVTNGTLTLNPDGSFEYLPNENFNGTDTFTYEVSDGNGGTDQATVTLTVAAVNDDPAFISNTLTIDEGATVSFTADNLAADDIDSLRGRLTFEISEVVGGTFFLNGQPLGAGETFTTASISFGELTFTDDGDEAPPSYSVTVRDPEGGFVSGAAEVFFTTVNDAPVLVTNTFVISEGQRLALNEGGNVNLLAEDDTASDAELIYSVSNVVGGGFFDLNAAPIESFTQAQLNNGDVFFVHNDEEIAPSFDIAVSDGEASTDPTPGVIEFISVNDAPTLETVQLSVTEGATIPLTPDNFVGSDPDTEAANLTFEVSDLAGGQFNLFEGGVVAAEAITSFSQSQLIAGQIQFVDDGDQLPPSFNLTLTDGEFTTAPVPVTITEFINVNDPPTAVDDSGEGFTTSEDVVLTTPDILENDGDDDPEDTISISQIAGIDVSQGEITIPSGALVSVAEDGRLNYSPNGAFDDLAPGESRLDTFEYTLSDSAGATDTATVEIVVTGVNDAPTLAANTLSLFKGQTVVISANNLLVNDPDTPLNEQVFTLSEVTGGEFQLNGEVTTTFSQQDIAQGLVSFIHDGGEAPPSYEVSVSDGLATTDPAAVTIDTFIPVSDIRGVFDYEQFLRFQVPTAEVAVPTDAVDGLLLAQFFDESFYLNQNPDVADAVNAGVFSSGYQHFVLSGLAEGRNPSLLYDEAFYLANNEDVAQAVTSGVFTSGLVHFLQAGHEEGRDPSALFRQRDYLTNNADVETAIESGAVQSGFDHFINFGANEDRLPPLYLYNEEFYLSSNPDVAAAVQTGFFTDGFAHFASIGQSEGRNPSSLFDQADYLAANPDIAAAVAGGTFSSGFQHYVAFGRFEERAVF